MNMNNETVSIVLPVYNAQDYINESIYSILNQTFTNFELIIIDDGSTDKSYEIINSFDDPRIKILKHERNLGLIKSLNEGIRLSSGELIARMDADDISQPKRLEKQVNFLKSNHNIGVCSTWYEVMARKKYIKRDETDPEKVKSLLLYYCPLAHPTVMFKKSIIEKVNYYSTDYPHAEDYELWIRLIEITNIANIPEVLFRYRPHDNQVSNKFKSVQNNSIMRAQNNLLKRIGISPSEQENNVNSKIFFREFPEDVSFILECENWLIKIIEANLSYKYFNEEALAQVTFDTWLLICTHLAGKGIKTKDIFYSSRLFNKKYFKGINQLKFIVKDILYS